MSNFWANIMNKKTNQDQKDMEFSVISSQSGAQQQRLDYHKAAVCIQGNECLQICSTKQCKSHAVVCADGRCKCHKVHNNSKLCSMVSLEFIVKKIEKEIIKPSPQLQSYIDLTLQKLIDQISQFRDNLERKVKKLGLTESMRQFFQTLRKGQFKHLTGQNVSKVLEQLNNQNKESKKNYAENLQKQLEHKWSQINGPVKQQIYSLENVVDKFVNRDPSKWSKISFLDSKVLSTQEQRKRLVQFFPQNKRQFETKLLYRASQNDSLVELFHEKCDGIAHTVTVLKTQYNKIIGGYTPLAWCGTNDYIKLQDKSRETFLFSISNNEKFTIAPESTKQISNYKIMGPTFINTHGICDLTIADESLQQKSSYAAIGNGYSNQKCKPNDFATYEQFSGVTSKSGLYFKILEWQVYQLTL